ncbi:MAG: glutamate 5-kinase [Desulfobulbaceae bacterium DB1]|nr:MAG: glutamate 5-kinase [Desulfobulbaceae bacterium DB1]
MTFQVAREKGGELRKSYLSAAKRVVVKVGSAVLTTGSGLNQAVLDNLAEELTFLKESGREVILVSSGAVASGRKKLGLGNRVLRMREKQAAAAVGQSSLMHSYEDLFDRHDQKVAQVLLTHDDFAHRDRYLNVRNTIFTLFEWGILPIINENDTVSVKELRFGDNDTLGAMVANLIDADAFICLTDVDGLYTGNPCTNPQATRVHTVAEVDEEVENMAGNICGSSLGTGGMRSKILAAKMVAAKGGCSFIGPGREPGVLRKLFAGELVGTFFLPLERKLASRKHWIAYTLRPKGYLVLDTGACRALSDQGKSLLPSGIREVRGKFGVGDPVHCLSPEGKAIAAGLVNYDSADIERIHGCHTSKIEELIGYKDSDEVIHRDNLVMLGIRNSNTVNQEEVEATGFKE